MPAVDPSRAVPSDRRLPAPWLAAPSALLVLVFVGLPVLLALWRSFFLWDGTAAGSFAGLGNYGRVLGDGAFWAAVGTGLVLVVANVLKLGVGGALALALHRLRGSRWQPFYLALLLLPLLVPGLVTLLVWRGFFDSHYGLINQALEFTHLKGLLAVLFPGSIHAGQDVGWLKTPGLAVPALILWGFPWVSAGGTLLFLAALGRIRGRVYEAAALDCIRPGQVFRHVELPLLLSRAAPAAALVAVGTLQNFGLQLLLLGPEGGAGGRGLTPGLYMYRRAFVDGRFGEACASAVVLGSVLLGLVLLLRRLWRTVPLLP